MIGKRVGRTIIICKLSFDSHFSDCIYYTGYLLGRSFWELVPTLLWTMWYTSPR